MKAMYDYEQLRNDLNDFLETNKISIRCFCEKSGINVSNISRFLNGKYIPGEKTFMSIVNTINKNIIDYTIGGTVTMDIINKFKFDELSIEQINELIFKLKQIRYDKLRNQKQDIQSDIDRLRKQQQLIEQLLEGES